MESFGAAALWAIEVRQHSPGQKKQTFTPVVGASIAFQCATTRTIQNRISPLVRHRVGWCWLSACCGGTEVFGPNSLQRRCHGVPKRNGKPALPVSCRSTGSPTRFGHKPWSADVHSSIGGHVLGDTLMSKCDCICNVRVTESSVLQCSET